MYCRNGDVKPVTVGRDEDLKLIPIAEQTAKKEVKGVHCHSFVATLKIIETNAFEVFKNLRNKKKGKDKMPVPCLIYNVNLMLICIGERLAKTRYNPYK